MGRSSGRGRLFDTVQKWQSHGRHHDRQEDTAALAANTATRAPASTSTANPGWLSGTAPSIHDTAFDAYADVDVGAALEHGLRPITWTPRKLLHGAATAFRTLLTKASAGPGPLDTRACAGLALFATDVLANDSPLRGGARTANARTVGLQDRIRAAFNGAYLSLRSAATARASAAAARTAAAAAPPPVSPDRDAAHRTPPPESGALPAHVGNRFVVLMNLGEPRAATETLTPSVPAEANDDTFFVLDEVHTQLPRPLSPTMLSKTWMHPCR